MHMENGEEQDQEVGREEPQAGTSQQQQQEDDEEGVRAPIPQKQVPVPRTWYRYLLYALLTFSLLGSSVSFPSL